MSLKTLDVKMLSKWNDTESTLVVVLRIAQSCILIASQEDAQNTLMSLVRHFWEGIFRVMVKIVVQ